MKKIQLIVECNMDDEKENFINGLGIIKYGLPMINSYVVEIPETELYKLQGMEGLKNVYQNTHITAQMNNARRTVNADLSLPKEIDGRGVTIAILDTGIAPVPDFLKPKNRIVGFKDFVNGRNNPYDDNAHGTHVAGISAGNGYLSRGKYCGIAPNSNIVSVKILDKDGRGNSSDALAGLQWVVDNRKKYNIKIVNLSIGTADIGNQDPLVRAVEVAWDLGIVITIAAGNNGPDFRTVTSPGISRKAITIGASDDANEVMIQGTSLINFSGRGPTSECIIKPDIIAPGTGIVSCLSNSIDSEDRLKELKIVDKNYVQMSGTSMSTPIISGAIALLLQKYPNLSPDDVKYNLKKSAIKLNYPQNQQGWGLIDINKLVNGKISYVKK